MEYFLAFPTNNNGDDSFSLSDVISTILEEIKSKSDLVQTSLISTDAKELYEELQKMRNSIEMTFESNQMPSDMEGDKPLPVS